MNNRLLVGFAIAGLVTVAAAAVAIGSYNAGVAHGLVESGRMIAAAPPGSPFMYVWPRPWGFAFFPTFPIVFFLLFFFVARGMLWRSRWHSGWHHRYDGVPPMFEEWHRRAHATQPPSPRTPETDLGRVSSPEP